MIVTSPPSSKVTLLSAIVAIAVLEDAYRQVPVEFEIGGVNVMIFSVICTVRSAKPLNVGVPAVTRRLADRTRDVYTPLAA